MAVIKFPCAFCAKPMAVEAEWAGRKVRCPHCQQVVEAPAGDPPPMTAGENPFSFPAPSPDPQAPPEESDISPRTEPMATPPIEIKSGRQNWALAILVPYAALMTIMAITYYVKYANAIQESPLEQIPDLLGDFQQKQTKTGAQSRKLPPPDQDLPAKLTTTLGQPLRIGAIEVTPLSVEYRPWSGYVKQKNRTEPTEKPIAPTLVLHLRLKNVSQNLSFYPTDPYFDRNPKYPNDKPYTLVDVGGRKFYGGLIEYVTEPGNTERSWLKGQEKDNRPLGPGESRETVTIARPRDGVLAAVEQTKGPIVWRVHVRRGTVPYQGAEIPVSAVVGVKFTAADVKKVG